MAEIAFFGLGTMGLPMALNLARAGHRVRILPRSGKMEAPNLVAQHGGLICSSLREMVGEADFIISIVPDDAAVRDIYLNPDMQKAVRPGSLIIEMTSCSPDIVREVERVYREFGVSVLDAPVTGALPRARAGTLTIMGAGDPEDFRRAEGVFAPMAEKVYQLGKVGNGKLIKAMTNLLGAVNLAAVGECYRFAAALGLDMDQLAAVVESSAGGSTQFTRNFGKMVAHDYCPAFTLGLLRKDMGIALDCAASLPDLAMPLAECAYRLYQRAAEHDREDCSAIALLNKRDA